MSHVARQVESVVAQLAAEDRARAEQAQRKREETRAGVQQYLADRERWRNEEKKRAQEELKSILEHQVRWLCAACE